MKLGLKIGLVCLIIIALIIVSRIILLSPSECFKKPEISDIQIQPIDENSIKIIWRTDTETYSTVMISEQDKVNEILKKSFSCNLTGNLNLAGEKDDDIFKKYKLSFSKYNCSFSYENGELSLIHNGNSYGYCTTGNYLSCISRAAYEQNSTNHSVIFDILQLDTEYTFDIYADNACELTSIKTVKFRMQEKNASGASRQATGGMSFEESIERGLTILEKVELSEDEKAKQSNLIKNIPEEVKQEFNTKYEAWKETWDDPYLIIHSNPRMFAQSRQYEEFLSFCKEQDKTIWPLLFQKYEQGDELVKMVIIDLTYTEYGSLLDEIRQESTKERYTAEGAYIAPSENANMMKYIKKLLALI
ncbi:MAG: hypothetical protein FIA99_10950 [Ruminiclostridium sp.]|nr:hypothetical protein [Ruminiclostridium sp.]